MSLKHRFPFFQHQSNESFVYLDSAATSHKPDIVLAAMNNCYEQNYATVHRSSYIGANSATSDYEKTRQQVAQFIGADNATNIVWTKGTTESINLVAYAWGESNINQGDSIVVSGSEHHANFVPWQQLAKRKNAKLHIININNDGQPDLEHYQELLKNKPKLVAIQHCSNVTGNILPIELMIKEAKAVKAKVLIDGAQAVSQLNVNVKALNCDLYAFSAHKMYGPTGMGVLYISDEMKSEFSPFHFGGEMVQTVDKENSTFREIPSMLESGTPNIVGVVGLGAAIDFINSAEYKIEKQQILSLYAHLLNKLTQFTGIRIYGDTKNNIGIVSFNIDGETAHDIGTLLSQQNIACRVGFHCAMPLHQRLNTNGTIRVSFGIYNNKEDIDRFILALTKSLELLDF